MNKRLFATANICIALGVLTFFTVSTRTASTTGPAIQTPAPTATPTPTPTPGCPPSSPGEIGVDLERAIEKNPKFYCAEKWYYQNNPSFGNWKSGGSMNLPVVGAAVGLYRFPMNPMLWKASNPKANPSKDRINYVDWMIWFLASQVGEDPMKYFTGENNDPNFRRPTYGPAEAPRLRYFRGSEQFSNTYDASVVATVVAVRYWAHDGSYSGSVPTKKIDHIKELTKKYLQANWLLYGLAAGESYAWRYKVPGRSESATTKPAPHTEYNPAAPRLNNQPNTLIYDGHFLALAGSRSTIGKYHVDFRAMWFNQAINNRGRFTKPPSVEYRILEKLEQKWADLPTRTVGENLYGLTDNDVTKLKRIITESSEASVSALMPWITKIRLATNYRYMGWPGQRATSMATNTSFNNPSMFGVVYRKTDAPDGRPTGTFLYPWRDSGKTTHATGWCRILPNDAGKIVMRAYHEEVVINGRVTHRETTQDMDMPQAKPTFQVVLTPDLDKPPFIDDTWPPAKMDDANVLPPLEPDDPDTPWVTSTLPAGAVTIEDGDSWLWVDDDPASNTDSIYVHQSNVAAGLHQHGFYLANETLSIQAGEKLYAYVYLDPLNPPREVMLQWHSNAQGWNHRAYWGENLIAWGIDGQQSRRNMGPLPGTGGWVRLEVPAKDVGLEGQVLNGIAFTLFGGRATWDNAGKTEGDAPTINLAVGKTATQSSTYSGSSFQAVAGLAIDGNTNGSFFNSSVTHTNFEGQAWWQVDLGASYALDRINIWNRTDCCSDRLSNFYVFVSDEPFTSNDPAVIANQPDVHTRYFAGSALTSVVDVGRTGRYVRVQHAGTNYLSLAEVEVFGVLDSSSPPPPPPTPNISINDVSVTEGNSGSVNASFTVSLSTATTNPVQVNYATANGSALSGSDYTSASGTLIFSAGQTTKTVNIAVTGDTALEANETFFVNLASAVNAVITDAQGQSTILNDDSAPPPPPPVSSDVIWVEDGLPAGSVQSAGWNWTTTTNPAPYTGTRAHQPQAGTGIHQQFFYDAPLNMRVNHWDTLIAYVYLNPANPPRQVMLQWYENGGWEHRAYWGENLIQAGVDGTHSRQYMGRLPALGVWTRLEVPAWRVGLEGKTVTGLAFTLYDGSAVWDRAGKAPASPASPETVWVDDGLPAGAQNSFGWNWIASNPTPFSGVFAHQSPIVSGAHQVFFNNATARMTIRPGDLLTAMIYIDPANLPSQVMLQWQDTSGSWEHRAYWGANLLPVVAPDGTAGRRRMGELPPAGRWIRLEVPAHLVGLENQTVMGLAFTQYNGRATWDRSGKLSAPVPPSSDTVWVGDAVPANAVAESSLDSWRWIQANPPPVSGLSSHQSDVAAGAHQHYFTGATSGLTVNTGDTLVTYVYLDPLNPPREVMLQWNDGTWAHRAYWGEALLPWGLPGTDERRHMGPLPPVGRWVRLEVPAYLVGLEGRTVNGTAFTLFDGRVTWDHTGKK